jgi:DNA polymerase-3 subunit chi
VTEITFHFNVPERTLHACRLLRKATRQGAQVAVTGSAEALARLDRELWAFEPTAFVPHVRLRTGTAELASHRHTRVWLVEDALVSPHQEVLVNLGDAAPRGFESYGKLIEIVSGSEDDRAAARLRWKHYAHRGYPIRRQEIGE